MIDGDRLTDMLRELRRKARNEDILLATPQILIRNLKKRMMKYWKDMVST
jgi:hypothetical protein